MIKKICTAVITAFFIFYAGAAFPQEGEPVKGNVAVFALSDPGLETEAVAVKSVVKAYETFNLLGRFLPVEQNRVAAVMESREASAEDYRDAARELGVDLYVIIYAFRQGALYSARIEVGALSPDCKDLAGNLTVTSRITSNIPLKIAREIAYLHRDLPLRVKVLKQVEGLYLVSAGQWHGLVPGAVKTVAGESVKIMRTSRFRSMASIAKSSAEGDALVLSVYPDYKRAVRAVEKEIDFYCNYKYALTEMELKGDNPEKRFMKGVCIINIGASLVVPGYGACLSTGYMGVKEGKPDVAGIVVSAALILTHYTLTECMTGFKSNFFPWIRDSDKTVQVQNLQIFLWSTLLTTFTVSFLDQLAYQYRQTQHLPPFFLNRNLAAAALSLFIPGGGLFYKGYRAAGWCFYVAEMSLAGYGSYSWGKGQGYLYVFSAMALVKLADIICAYLINPSYPVYRLEQDRQPARTTFSFNVLPTENGGRMYRLGLVRNFM